MLPDKTQADAINQFEAGLNAELINSHNIFE
jgi:hypothetical protein